MKKFLPLLLIFLLLGGSALGQSWSGQSSSDARVVPPYRFCLGPDNGSDVCLFQSALNVASILNGSLSFRLTTRTVGALPASTATNIGQVYWVSDGTTGSDCTVGSGATFVLCISNGHGWQGTGGGGSAITLETNGVNNASQAALNLVAGGNITLNNTSGGNVSITSTAGGGNVTTAPAGGVSQNIVQQLNTNFGSNVFNQERWATPSYNWSQSIAGTLTASTPATVTLTPCPVGYDNAYNVNFPYVISINNGTEQVQVTGGSCVTGAASGTVQFTPLNNYSNPYTLGSATSGIQEAIYDACRQPDYTLSVGGNCVVNLEPANLSLVPNYNIYTRVWVLGRNTFNIMLRGNNALLSCHTRDACLTLGHLSGTGAHGTIDRLSMTASYFSDGVNIADVTAAAGTYTIHTASAHPFSMTANNGGPDYVYVNFYVGTGANQTIRGIFKVTSVADNTHFTFVNGSTTFSNASGFGWAALEDAAIENNMDGSTVSELRTALPTGGNLFHFFLIGDNDQHWTINKLTDTPNGVLCTANFCGALVYQRGDNGSAGIPYLTNSEISMQCNGNGVIAASGNGFVLDNSVIQGYSQFGVLDINGLVTSSFKDLYQESTGACNNPQAPAVAQKNQAGMMIQGQNVKISGNFPLSGTYPTFVTGGGGGSQINYFVVFKSTTLGTSAPYPVGIAQPSNGGVTINGAFPYIAMGASGSSQGVITYDLLATTGTTYTPLTGTQTIAVATAQTCTPTTNGWCTFTDIQAARSSYTIATSTSGLPLWYWPGPLSLFGATAQMDSAFQGINTTKGAVVSVVGLECSAQSTSGAMVMPALYSCLASDPGNGTSSTTTFLQQQDASNNSNGGLKGRINLGATGNLLGGSSTHLITLIDSNVAKTAAYADNRPPNDASDAFLGSDCAAGSNCVSYGGAQHSFYIGNVGDGSSWKERLTSSQKTFSVPISTTNFIDTGLSPATLTDGATITWAIGGFSLANAKVTIAGNRTLNLTGLVSGGNYTLAITQDATGSRTLALGTGCTWKVFNGGAGAISLTTTANAIDILTFYYDGSTCYANLGKNYS